MLRNMAENNLTSHEFLLESGLGNVDREGIEINAEQFSSVPQLCPNLCSPLEYCMPGFPVYHQLPELAQTQVRVSDAIQPSHPLPSPFPPAFNLS